MGLTTIEGPERFNGEFPPYTRLLIVSEPDKQKVFYAYMEEGGTATVSLGPGKYTWSAVAENPAKKRGVYRFVGSFLHEVDEATWEKLGTWRPQLSRSRLTSDGMRHFCGYPRCKHKTSSQLSMFLHEAAHMGLDPLKNPEDAESAALAIGDISKETRIKTREAARAAFSEAAPAEEVI